MKTIIQLFLAFSFFITALFAEEEKAKQDTVLCGKETIVYFDLDKKEGYISEDGHYALGWTLRPADKNTKPVDWTKIQHQWKNEFLSEYETWNEEEKPTPYLFKVGIIDCLKKTFTEIPSKYAAASQLNHWNLGINWLNDKYAVLTINSRFSTADLFVIHFESQKTNVTQIFSQVENMTQQCVTEHRPLSSSLEVFYEDVKLSADPDIISIPFLAGKPKSDLDGLSGNVIFQLHSCKPLMIIADDANDSYLISKYFFNEDNLLNNVYSELKKKLITSKQKELVKEQQDWLKKRNEALDSFLNDKFLSNEPSPEEYCKARDEQAIKLTKERRYILEKKLDALKTK